MAVPGVLGWRGPQSTAGSGGRHLLLICPRGMFFSNSHMDLSWARYSNRLHQAEPGDDGSFLKLVSCATHKAKHPDLSDRDFFPSFYVKLSVTL